MLSVLGLSRGGHLPSRALATSHVCVAWGRRYKVSPLPSCSQGWGRGQSLDLRGKALWSPLRVGLHADTEGDHAELIINPGVHCLG